MSRRFLTFEGWAFCPTLIFCPRWTFCVTCAVFLWVFFFFPTWVCFNLRVLPHLAVSPQPWCYALSCAFCHVWSFCPTIFPFLFCHLQLIYIVMWLVDVLLCYHDIINTSVTRHFRLQSLSSMTSKNGDWWTLYIENDLCRYMIICRCAVLWCPRRKTGDVWCLPPSGISGMSFDSILLFPLLFFCLVL